MGHGTHARQQLWAVSRLPDEDGAIGGACGYVALIRAQTRSAPDRAHAEAGRAQRALHLRVAAGCMLSGARRLSGAAGTLFNASQAGQSVAAGRLG